MATIAGTYGADTPAGGIGIAGIDVSYGRGQQRREVLQRQQSSGIRTAEKPLAMLILHIP